MFSKRGKTKNGKRSQSQGSTRPASSKSSCKDSGYGSRPATASSTMTFQPPHSSPRPVSGHPRPTVMPYPQPLAQYPLYGSPSANHYQTTQMVPLNGLSPPTPHYHSPPLHSPYTSPNYAAWSSSTNIPNPVYPNSGGHSRKSKIKSTLSLPAAAVSGTLHAASKSYTNLNEMWNETSAQYLNQGSALCDLISTKLNDVITCIDAEVFGGDERELLLPAHAPPLRANGSSNLSLVKSVTSGSHSSGTNHFSKVWLYSNSRLPPYLPPCKFYISTYPLLCLAAQYSLSVYKRPTGQEKEDHIPASVLHGTKAMTLKSLPIDDMNTVVFAIRGSDSFIDWAVNFRPAPTSPRGFLDDGGNLCHAGFLCVAKAMVKPVAQRLRALLQDDPSRSTASLLITGHSAGGAVAQLLYAHMLSDAVASELTHLAAFFKRVHCVAFGAPPVSLLPLPKPRAPRHAKSLFFAFANEGDPVVRADRAVLASLLKLLALPAPAGAGGAILNSVVPALKQAKKAAKRPTAHLKALSSSSSSSSSVPPQHHPPHWPVWKVPSPALSCAGRVVLLRERLGARGPEDIEACQVSDQDLRAVVFGDPMCHTMALYARRMEILATKAVTAGGIAG